MKGINLISAPHIGPIKLSVTKERWPLRVPFHITGYTFETTDTVLVTLEADGHVGYGEASGVYYRQDDVPHMLRQVMAVRPAIESGSDRQTLQKLLPASGARNALDCALWDLEAKLTRRSAWEIAGLDRPRPLLTTFTCGAGDPDHMAAVARALPAARALKLKLTGQVIDLERVRAVRAARPDVWLGVDANQGFTRSFLEHLLPGLLEARVQLIEQPCRVGEEAELDGFQSPISIAADESAQTCADLQNLSGRFQVVNIKLDKCGGLSEGLAMARAARQLGLQVMVGNMMGTSFAMAPSFLVGQLCSVVDLDGPTFLKRDRSTPVHYDAGMICCPEELWGGPPSERAPR